MSYQYISWWILDLVSILYAFNILLEGIWTFQLKDNPFQIQPDTILDISIYIYTYNFIDKYLADIHLWQTAKVMFSYLLDGSLVCVSVCQNVCLSVRSRKITARRWLHKYIRAECGASSFTWYLYQMCNTDVRVFVRLSVSQCLS